MASVNMTKSPNYLSAVDIWTDADVYSENATSVDIWIHKTFDGPGPTYYYNMVIEYWTGTYWKAMQQWLGYFSSSAPTKYFYLSGKPAGSYRITAYINLNCQNCGETYINRTDAFIVRR